MALDLYEWNARLSAAFMHDLAHLEVGIRNAYDQAMTLARPAENHWVFDADAVFPPHITTAADGAQVDSNAKTREQLASAIGSAANAEQQRLNRASRRAKTPTFIGPIRPTPGHVIAELTFGFWRYLTRSSLEKRVWVPYLHQAFPPGTARKLVDSRVAKLNELRNRVAHHEPLDPGVASRRIDDLMELAGWLSLELRDHIATSSQCRRILETVPVAQIRT